MQNSSIKINGGNNYIRHQVKQARIEANDSQKDLALALGKSRVTISDMERSRVVINPQDLFGIAINYNKPISYFFPPELVINKEDLTPLEQEILFLFNKLPNTQQHIAIEYMKEQVLFLSKVLQKLNIDQNVEN